MTPSLLLLLACPPAEPPDPLAAPKDVAAAPADAVTTPSGLAWKSLGGTTECAADARPGARDKVTVHYTGWQTDGTRFDSSVERNEPATFPLNGVIAGWTEGLQLLCPGQQARLWIPEALAYKGMPGKPSGMLVFDVELLSVTAAPKPPPTPADVAAPPADATRTASGLAWKELQAGTGTDRPTPESRVEVHYTGWTTDGAMFDSSVMRGRPATFGVTQVIPGWTEGLQLMTVGQKVRFWIPSELAYGDTPTRPGAPAGMLVFDVELVGIQ